MIVNNVKQGLVTTERDPLWLKGLLKPKGSLSWFPDVAFVGKNFLWETHTTFGVVARE